MSQTTVNLGYVLINRGEYVADPVTKYYKDNVVQYLGSAFIAAPVDYDEETNPLAYVTVAPYDTDPNNPNEGWKVFASDAAYVNSFMFFTENPEWVYVVCDKEDKILFGVKQDGEFYFGAGCPSQVKEYVEQRISEVSPENYEQVLAFLQDYLGSDTTLKMIIDALDAAKLDKEGLDADALTVQSITESPEYLQVTTDSEDHILEGIKSDGTKVIGGDLNVGGNSVLNGDLQVLGSIDISGATYSLCQSPEWIKVLVDSQDRIIAGVRTDGSVYIGQLEGLDDKLQEMLSQMQAMLDEAKTEIDAKLEVFNSVFSVVDNPEFIQVTTDSEGKILQSRNPEGVNKEYVGIETPKVSIDGATVEMIQDPEGRTEIKTDSEGKILSYRDSDGENVSFSNERFRGNVSFNGKIDIDGPIGANGIKETSSFYANSINALNPYEYYYPRLLNMNVSKRNSSTIRPLVLCHISDIHGDGSQYNRIVDFVKLYDGLYDDLIITGDIVATKFDDSISFLDYYNNKALLVIGNHDAWERNVTESPVIVPAIDDYNKFFAPFIDKWKVTQPENASSGKCYYYKDYPSSKIRLIVADCMHNSQEQTDFIGSALNGAANNDYSIIMSQHYPAGDIVPFKIPFQSIDINGEGFESNGAYLDIVDTFINNGGKFICWLCGHHHVDLFGYIVDHPQQLQICIDCARLSSDFDTLRILGTKTQDSFNFYSFDTVTGIFSLLRVGAVFDRHLQRKESIIFDYKNKTLL